MFAPPLPFSAIDIVRSHSLVGSRVAVQQGSKIFVSPAMWSLIAGAKSESELLHVLQHLKVQQLPDLTRLPAYFPALRVFS